MKARTQRLMRFLLAILMATGLAAPATFGQAVFLDFNTPGQFTNLFGVRNRAGNQTAVWYETNASGVANSRSLEGVAGSLTDNTLTYLGDSFTFPPVDGATLNMSIMFKGKPRPASGNPVVQLGFFSSTNTVHFVTNSFMEGNSLANWINLRLVVANNTTNMQFEYGVLVTTNRGAAFTYANALTATTPVGPIAGNNASFTNWYRLTATFTRGPFVTNISISGALQDMGADGTVPGATVMTLASSPITNLLVTQGFLGSTFYPAIRALEGNGADNLDNFAVWMTNGAPVITTAPGSQSISTYRQATFTTRVDGTPPFAFTWYTNGVVVPGATNPTYTTPLFTAADSISVYAAVTNASGGTDSSATPATLTVTTDGTAPNVVSVGSVDGLTVGVAFSEAMNAAAAGNPGNYTVTSGTVTGATVRADGRVALALSSAITGNFTVTVSGVTDLAGNALSVNNASSTVLGLTASDVGAPMTAGASFSSSTGDIDVTAGGQDTGSSADQFHATMQVRTGDFDLKVRVQDIIRARNFNNIQVNRDEIAGAGFMVRESLNPGSRDIYMRLFPRDSGMPAGGNRIQWLNRGSTFGGAGNLNPPNADLAAPAYLSWFPNAWMRMRRANNTFTLYWSTNGVNWTQGAQTTQIYPTTVLAGLATCAHHDDFNYAVTAQYRNYGDSTVAGAGLGFAINLPANVGMNLTWPVTSAVPTITVTATNTGTIFPSNEIHFVWQRGDGAGGFTNVPNVTAAPASTPFTNSAVGTFNTVPYGVADSGSQFRVIARGPGGLAVTSSVTILMISYSDSAAPAVVNSSVLLGSNTLSLIFNEAMIGTGLSNTANYVITNSLGQAVTVTGVFVEYAGQGTNNVTRVILTTATALTNNTAYIVRLNNLIATNGVAIPANTLVAAQTPGTVKVEIFNNLAADSLLNTLTGNAKYQANIADYVYWTNVWNFGNSGGTFGDRFNSYGGRISGYFVAPSNGQYRFYVRGDDGFAFWMNTNALDSWNPNRRTLLCSNATANANYSTTITSQLSTNVTLVAGQAYYMEGLWKENSGGDGFSMAFREAGVAGTPGAAENADGRFFQPALEVAYTNTAIISAIAPFRIEVFTNIAGGTVANLTNAPTFLANAPSWVVYGGGFGYGADLLAAGGFPATLDSYGVRLSAYFVAPSNGFYRFFLRSDDDSQLLMNTNGSAPAGKVSISYLPSWRPTYTNVTAVQSVNGVTNTGVSMPIQLTNGQFYYIEALLKENVGGDGIGVAFRSYIDLATATNSVVAPPSNEVAQATFFRPVTNGFSTATPYWPPVLMELYQNYGVGFAGGAAIDLQNNGKFQAGMPDATMPVPSFSLNRDGITSQYPGDNYGVRLSGYFVAPSNSVYRFFVKSDDGSVLFMNTNGVDFGGKVQIASLGGARNSYANNDSSMSTAITLTNGQRYYMEFLYKEGGGGDYGAVAFVATGTSTTAPTAPAAGAVIPAEFFSPTIGPVTANGIAQSPGTPSGGIWNDLQTVTLSVNNIVGAMPIGIQWRKNGLPIPGSNGLNLVITLTPAEVGINTYSVFIYNQQSSVERFINVTVNGLNIDNAPPFIAGAVGNGLTNEVTVTFSEALLDSTATNTANYSIAGLTILGAYMKPGSNVVALITSAQTPGARYTVVVNNVRDMSRNRNMIVPNSSFTFTSWALQRGFVTVDLFTGLNGGTFVQNLLSEPKFIFNTPDSTQYVPYFAFGSFAPGGANIADNYGARVYGWFIAPSNGNYRFYIRSDDMSELWMSTNSATSMDPAAKVPIAAVNSGTCCQGYGNPVGGPVTSPNITLNAGQLYYMESIFKEGGGGDGVGVAFREAGDQSVPPTSEVIPAYFFASLGNPDITASLNITNQPAGTNVGLNIPVALTVGAIAVPIQTVFYQWQFWNGSTYVNVGAFTNVFGTNTTLPLAFNSAGTYQYRALVSVPGILRTSVVATVTVTNPPPEISPTGPTLTWASVSTNGVTVTAQFNEAVTSGSAQTAANYTLAGAPSGTYTVSGAVLLSDAKTVVLTVSPALTPGNATNYTLTAANIVDTDDALSGGGSYTFYMPGGSLRYDVYAAQPAGFPVPFPTHTPDFTGVLTNAPGITVSNNFFFTSAQIVNTNAANYMENYAARIYGYLIPPSNGLYRFFITGDDIMQLWMSTNSATSASPTGKVLLASAPSANLGYVNAANPASASSFIQMNAGQRYYVEALFKEGTGGDYVAVAVREQADLRVPVYPVDYVPATFFGAPETLRIDPQPSLTPNFAETETNAILGLVVGAPAAIQWYSNNVLIAGATNATYALSLPLPLAGANFQVIATNAITGVISNQFAVTVTADATAPSIVSVQRDSTGTNFIINFSELLATNGASAANLLANYVFSDGANTISLASARIRPDGRSVTVSVAPSVILSPATAYYVTNNNVGDRALTPNVIAANTVATFDALTFTTNFLALDFFSGANSYVLLSNDVRFINDTPDFRLALGSFQFQTTNTITLSGRDNYGVKAYGWFMPPTNGQYKFYARGDDGILLSINTNGPSQNSKVIVVNQGCCGNYNTNATPIDMTNGTAYYVEALFFEGGGQDYFSVTFRDSTALAPTNGPGSSYASWGSLGHYAGAEVAAGNYFGLFGSAPAVSNLTFTLQPIAATSVVAGASVTLSAVATNAPANGYLFHQWQASTDGGTTWTNVGPNANFLSDYRFMGNGSNYTATYYYTTLVRAVATLPGGLTATSATATVTVPDAINLLSVGSFRGTNVVLTFDKPLDLASAQESSNYQITNSTGYINVLSAVVQPDQRTVWLTFNPPSTVIYGDFLAQMNFITDRYSTNDFTDINGVPGRVLAADFVNDVGSAPGTTDPLLRGSAASLAINSLDVTAGGSDIFGTADGEYFVARNITGNFDIKARVAALTNLYRGMPDINAKAALQVRVSTNGNSRMMTVNVAPANIPLWPVVGTDRAQFIYRDTIGASAVTAANVNNVWTPGFVTPWIRLVRQGSAFFGYTSRDGTNWILISSRDTAVNGGAYPDTVLVGFATSSHNNGGNPLPSTVTAQYRDIYFPVETPTIVTQPAGVAATVGNNVNLTVVATNPANSGNLTYQWRKGGTNIIGANAGTLSLPAVNTSDAGTYTVLVANDGGGVLSANAVITVGNTGATAASETLAGVQGMLTNFNASLLIGNNSDPEGRPLSIVALSGVAPVTFYTDFETNVPNGTTIYNNAAITNGVGVTNSKALALTAGVGAQSGGWIINDLVPGRSVSAFTATFMMRLGDMSGNAADGISFNVANDMPNAYAGGEAGSGTGLTVALDQYDNGNLEAPAFNVKWRGAQIAHIPIAKQTNQNWVPVTITMRADGKLDLFLTNAAILQNFQTPYVPITGARFGFFARTGGEFETHWLDEVSITVFAGQNLAGAGGTVNQTFNFNNGLPPNAYLFGVAGIVGSGGVNGTPYLRLNDALASQTGSLVLGDLLPGKVVNGFTANFSMRIGSGSAEPADGFSFNFASDVPYAAAPASGTSEEGAGTGLSICYDGYQAAGTPNTSAFRIKWNGTSLAIVTNLPPWSSTAWIPVQVFLNTNGAVTLTVNGTNVVSNLATPYTPRSGGRFGIYARTGGAFQTHWIDELSISMVTPDTIMLAGTNVLYSTPNLCGTDTIYYMVSDGQGGTTLDSATVQLVDVTPPVVVSVATNRTVFANGSCLGILPDLTTLSGLSVTDNCAVVTITQAPPAGASIALGVTTVTLYALDAWTNITTSTAFVTNRDITIPTITCPAPVTVTANAGFCYATGVALGTPTTDDNCSVATVSNNAPAQLSVGVNTVVWSVIDGSGNSNGCQQTVTVLDNVPTIATQPQSTNVLIGGTAIFDVTPVSCTTVTYQWYFGAAPLSGATNSAYTNSSVRSCDTGGYTVVVSNSVGSVTSSVATLTVTNSPLLISPGGLLVTTNQDDCNHLFLTGGGTYDWEINNAAGVMGTNWDLVSVSGGIEVQSTSGNPFTINLRSLTGTAPGLAANWDYDTTNTFTIATATDAVTDFAANKFALSDVNFSNDLAGGVFSVEASPLAVKFTPNHAPIATSLTNIRVAGLTWKIKIADLLSGYTSDVDGDGRTLTVLGTSTNGVTVTTNATHVLYNSTGTVDDEFTYTVSDVRSYRGGDTVRTATGTIRLAIAADGGTNFNAVAISYTNGVVGMRFAGIPGYTYDVQRTTSLTPPITWTTLHTTNCPPTGLFDYIDLTPPMGAAYYRTARP